MKDARRRIAFLKTNFRVVPGTKKGERKRKTKKMGTNRIPKGWVKKESPIVKPAREIQRRFLLDRAFQVRAMLLMRNKVYRDSENVSVDPYTSMGQITTKIAESNPTFLP